MAIHNCILHNGELEDAGKAALYAGQLGLLAGWGVFTTLKVVEGIPFAWERHWARMVRDARLLNVEMPSDPDLIFGALLRLIAANRQTDCTLRLNVVRNGGGLWENPRVNTPTSDVIALTADSKVWPETVRLSVTPNGRFAAGEFVGAKILSWSPNLVWAERAQRAGADETILLNEHGRVAECTSANIFAVNGGEVRTPPLSEGCLPGITREVLLEEIRVPGISVREEALTLNDLREADSVFITSTTRDLRRVAAVDGVLLKSAGDVTARLSAAFSSFVQSGIGKRQPLALGA